MLCKLEYTAHAQAAPGDGRKWHIFLCCSLAVTERMIYLLLVYRLIGAQKEV